MEDSQKSEDSFEDIDLEIIIRSSKTEFKILTKLSQAIVASVISIADSDLVLVESEDKILYQYQKRLITLKRKFQI